MLAVHSVSLPSLCKGELVTGASGSIPLLAGVRASLSALLDLGTKQTPSLLPYNFRQSTGNLEKKVMSENWSLTK